MEPEPLPPQPSPKRSRSARRQGEILEFDFARQENPEPNVSVTGLATPLPPHKPELTQVESARVADPDLKTEAQTVPPAAPPPQRPFPRTESALDRSTRLQSPEPDSPVVMNSTSVSTLPRSTPTSFRKTAMSNPPLKPTTINDFKRNIDQQKREQASFGNVLGIVTTSILVGLILVTILAGFGGYQIWKRLNEQAVSLSDLDQKYEASVLGLSENLKRTQADLEKSQGQLLRQQEQISVLRSNLDKAGTDLKAERAARQRSDQAIAELQKRLSEAEIPRR